MSSSTAPSEPAVPAGRWSRLVAAVAPGVWAIAAVHFVAHLVTNGRYGIFRDELYYLACADHPAWGYVDQPPLSIWLLGLERAILGSSVGALRILPALAGAALVLLTARLARRLGGGAFAENLAALSIAVAPVVLVTTGFFSMNAFDLLFWVLAIGLLVRLAAEDDPRLWLPFGLVVGLGLLNKWSLPFLGFGLAVALPFSRLRRHLRSRHLWLGAALALALAAPYLAWNAAHGWPTLEFMENARRYKNVHLGPGAFLREQVLMMNPLTLPVWGTGLGALLFARRWRGLRFLGVLFLAVAALLVATGGKPYYLSPAYPLLLAPGAVALGAATGRRRWRWVRPAALALLIAGGVALAPLALPVLPPQALVRYQARLGIHPEASEHNPLGALPQYFADRFGWPEMVAAVARVYRDLPAAERERAAIVTSNYGEAGAIDHYGRRLGLPRATSQHNSYYFWGPPSGARVVIAVGIDGDDLRQAFADVEPAARVDSPWAMPSETGDLIYVCRGLRGPLAEAWEAGRHFI